MSKNCLGPKVAKLRKNAGLSYKELADRFQKIGIDLSETDLQRIESGDRVIFDFEIIGFTILFNCSPSDMFSDLDIN